MRRSILSPSSDVLTPWLLARGESAYRAQQIRRWLFEKRVDDWEDMTDLPKTLRAALAAEFFLWSGRVMRHHQSGDGTEKLLLPLPDAGPIECVLLRDRVRRSICISTQVGCGMGCVFCASGLDGVQRNLTDAEIVEQMLRLQQRLPADERITHLIVMGMGEPLANLDALLPALQWAKSSAGLGISGRRITVSTVGLPAGIERLAREAPSYRLAVSLHAPNDPLRNQLVPVNAKIGLDAILAAADHYFDASGRRLTFEYVLLHGINDGTQHAEQLAALLQTREALLNVIPYNPVPGLPYQTPTAAAQLAFRRVLENAAVRVKFRHRKGDEINAACGQLRRQPDVVLPTVVA